MRIGGHNLDWGRESSFENSQEAISAQKTLHWYREETQALFAVVVFGSTLSHPLAKPDCTYLHTTKREERLK